MSDQPNYPSEWDVAFVEARHPEDAAPTEYKRTVLTKGSVMLEGRPALVCDILWEQNIPVTMRDGAVLRVDVLRPVGTDRPVPALVEWSPYGKVLPLAAPAAVPIEWTSGMSKIQGADANFWVPNGYAIVNVAPRGDVVSDGDTHFWGGVEAADGHEIVEWAAAQDWSNGKIGLHGVSWLAIAQWFIAATKPPHLAAIAPWSGMVDMYRDLLMNGGIEDLFFINYMIGFPAGSHRIEHPGLMVAKHDAQHPYWTDKGPEVENITIPAYVAVNGAATLHRSGIEGFRRLASAEKWLRVNTTNEWYDEYDPENQADLLRFFDHFLAGVDNGWEKTPRVRMSVLDPGAEDLVNVPYSAWPIPETEYRRYHLDAVNSTLVPDAPQQVGAASYDAENGSVSFTLTADSELQIAGYPSVRLWVEAAGADDLDLFVLVEKLDAAGEVLVPAPDWAESFPPLNPPAGVPGRLRVSRRELDAARSTEFLPELSFGAPQKLGVGEVVPVDIAVLPVGMRWHAGEQLRLTVSGTYQGTWPVPTLNAGTHIIHTGPGHESWLQLPVVPAGGALA